MIDLLDLEKIDIIRKAFSNYAIITDDGHGWFTKGKRSFTDSPFYENEFNSVVEAKFMMLADFCGIEYHQLSPGAIDTALWKRENYEHELVKDILLRKKQPLGVSIHCDAFGTEQNGANGFGVYYYRKDEKYSQIGKEIARCVADAIIESDRENGTFVVPRHDNGICGANFMMLRETDAPWVLIESGFMTNDEDLLKLKDDKFRNNRAYAILIGLYNYIISINLNLNVMKIALFFLLGVVFFVLTKLNKALPKPDFSWKIFLLNHSIPVGLNLVGGIIIVFGFGVNEGAFVFNDKDVTFLVAAAMGVLGEVIFLTAVEAVNKNVKTRFGTNK
jgi:hypothetical protein